MNIWSDSMEQLFNDQSLLYIITGILIVILIILLSLVVRVKPKRKETTNEIETPIETIELDEDNSKIDIEQVISQLQRDIEEQKNGIKRFEDEQEEKSIISYQELFEQTQKEISNQEVKAEPINNKIENIENEQPIKKFRNSEFISPIFGRVDNDIKYPTIPSFREKEEEEKPQPIETIEIEKTIDLKPLQEEIKKNEEFLNMLKEFRKNLE